METTTTENYLYLWCHWMTLKLSHTCILKQCCHSWQGMNLAKVLKHLEQLKPLPFWNVPILSAVGSSYTCFQQVILWTIKYWNLTISEYVFGEPKDPAAISTSTAFMCPQSSQRKGQQGMQCLRAVTINVYPYWKGVREIQMVPNQ